MTESRSATRVSPFQLIFGPAVFDESRLAAVREQADAHDATSPAELFMLPAAGELLRELVPPEGGRETVAQVRALLFNAFQFWRHGRHVYRLTDAMLDDVVAAGATPAGSPQPPGEAGYLQLPANRMWARVAEDSPPEPVDGFFWSAPGAAADSAGRRLDLLFALGVRPGRPGLSLFDISLDATTQLGEWATVDARPDGVDFANVLPGGELQNYHAITVGAEALKFAALCFTRIAQPSLDWNTAEHGGETVHSPADG